MKKIILFMLLQVFAFAAVYQIVSDGLSKEINLVAAMITFAISQLIVWQMFFTETKTKTKDESEKIITVLMVFVYCYFENDLKHETLKDITEMLDGDITADDFIKKWLVGPSPTEQLEN